MSSRNRPSDPARVDVLADTAPSLSRLKTERPGGVERRSSARFSVGLWAHCQFGGAISQEALGDISPDGFLLRSQRGIEPGTRIRVAVGLPYFGGQRVASLSGRVVWVEHGADPDGVTHAGVELDHETEEADRELLKGFLALWSPPASADTPD